MRSIRIIPRLDVKDPHLVKGVQLEGLRVLGPPDFFSERYYMDGADELIYMDIVASLYGRNNLENLIRRTASRIFIPITVGGGIRTIEDIRRILLAGADKVAINTAAINNPDLISRSAKIFGNQCIVISIEAIRRDNGKYEALTDNGRECTGRDAVEWACQAYELGAGELLITSVDREGTGTGYDIDLIGEISNKVIIPVIAHGGAAKAQDLLTVIQKTQVSGVSAASIFHYHVLKNANLNKTESRQSYQMNISFSQSSSIGKKFKTSSLQDVKHYLNDAHVGKKNYKIIKHTAATEKEFWSTDCQSTLKATQKLVIVDYGRSNLFSVQNAFRKLGVNVTITSDPQEVTAADKAIVAGVGAFGDCIQGLKDRALDEALRVFSQAGKPVMGICLGMQMFMERSEEHGSHKGLGLIPGNVVKMTNWSSSEEKIRIPNIGWHRIIQNRDSRKEDVITLLKGISYEEFYYFNHSYIVKPSDSRDMVAYTFYGSNCICAAIRHENIVGFQFHPERSGSAGLRLYENFLNT